MWLFLISFHTRFDKPQSFGLYMAWGIPDDLSFTPKQILRFDGGYIVVGVDGHLQKIDTEGKLLGNPARPFPTPIRDAVVIDNTLVGRLLRKLACHNPTFLRKLRISWVLGVRDIPRSSNPPRPPTNICHKFLHTHMYTCIMCTNIHV